MVTFHTAGIIQPKRRTTFLIEPGREQLYVTDGYVNHRAASWWALRTDGDPAALGSAVREVVRRAGSETLINEMHPMDSLVVQAQAQTRFSLLLILVVSTIAALLAGVRLYGVEGADSSVCSFVSFTDEDGEANLIPADKVMLLASIHYESAFEEDTPDNE